jgi:hypothetical protein
MSVVVSHNPSSRRELEPSRQSRRFPVPVTFLRESGIVGLAAYLYFFVRGMIHAREADAMEHARWLVSTEKSLGIFHEQQLQSLILGHDWLVTLVNSIYIYGHWPVVVGTLTWLFIKHRPVFPVFRTAMVLSGVVGFMFFFFFPMAPPRFLGDLGFVDTVTLHSEAYRVLQPPSLTNQFAAMPSLHVGWNLLMGIAIVRYSSHWGWKVFGVMMPLAMWIATILTANHYLVDGIVGAALVLGGLAIAWKLSGPKEPVWIERRISSERRDRTTHRPIAA